MFERFTDEARAMIATVPEQSRRLGHRFVGPEHILLAVVSAGAPAGAVLRSHGVTPELVEEQLVHWIGFGAEAALFGDLDRAALATIGIDLDAVRARIEASFGSDALILAGHAIQHSNRGHRRPFPGRLVRHLVRRGRPGRRGRRGATFHPARQNASTGRIQGGHIPFTPRAKRVLERALRETGHNSHVGIEHIALAVIRLDGGLVPVILSSLAASAPELRAAILDRYRNAS
jgi:ATP-dependent Clp protease ATP-binding subunit ClpA